MRFRGPAPGGLARLPGVERAEVSGSEATLWVRGDVNPLLGEVARAGVEQFVFPEPQLEDIFLDLLPGGRGRRTRGAAVRNLLRALVARHAAFVALSGLLLAAFQFLICAAVASVDVSGRARDAPGVAAADAAGHGLRHAVRRVLGARPARLRLERTRSRRRSGAAVAIVLAARAVAGEAETGAIELLLSQPLSRGRYFAAQAGFALVGARRC